MHMLKAILFDLDDTLLDWSGFKQDWPVFEEEHHLRPVFKYVGESTAPLPDFQAFVEEYRYRTREGWQYGRATLIAPNLATILSETVDALTDTSDGPNADDLLKVYNWRSVPGTTLFPEVQETLTLIRSHGIKTAIVTNAHQPMRARDVELTEHGLLDYFPDCRISAADVGILKPHPLIFQMALDQLGATANEAVFVGDNPVADISGPKGIGMQTVLRMNGRVPPLLSDIIVPDGRIHSLTELPVLLDSWFPDWRR
jgi:putative hydrolase of the HAD superfamily